VDSMNLQSAAIAASNHPLKKCWCGLVLQSITYGDRDFPECPLHGTAYKANAEEIARTLPRPA
jgi:hypothetical protein